MTTIADTLNRRQRVARAVADANGCPVGCPSCAPTVDALLLGALPDTPVPSPRQEAR